MLSIFYGGAPPWATYATVPHVVEVAITDTTESIFVKPGAFSGTSPNSGNVYENEGMIEVLANPEPANATIAGSAADLVLWLWDRADDSRLMISGDGDAIAAFSTGVGSSID